MRGERDRTVGTHGHTRTHTRKGQGMALDIYFREDIAGLIVGILVEKGTTDSRDLMALASLCRIPWGQVRRAYWAQVGEREVEHGR